MVSLADVYGEITADPFWDGLRLSGVNFVPGFGASRPKVLLVGEAPGATENARLRPFCGPSGRVLDQLMAVAGLQLEPSYPEGGASADRLDAVDPPNAFVTNVVKYRPPGNRTPSIAEILHAVSGFQPEQGTDMDPGAGSLRREWLALGRPPLIVCVGGVAHTALHPASAGSSISLWAGRPPEVRALASGGKVFFSSQFHPAFGLRRGPKIQEKMERHWSELGEWIRAEGILD